MFFFFSSFTDSRKKSRTDGRRLAALIEADRDGESKEELVCSLFLLLLLLFVDLPSCFSFLLTNNYVYSKGGKQELLLGSCKQASK